MVQGALARSVCIDCGHAGPLGRFCTWCAAPRRPRAASAKAKEVYGACRERLIELFQSARKATTVARNEAVWESLARFARDKRDLDPLHIAPLDIVCWLMEADKRARTTFHKEGCPDYRGAADGRCDGTLGCHKRLKHAAARTKTFQLQAWFRSAGFTTPWDARTGTGNPCRSQQVQEYLSCMLKEQLACGVHSDLAPLMAPELVDELVRAHVFNYVRELKAVASGGEPMQAYWAIQSATVLAFLAHCPDRSYDIARLTFQDVDFVEAGSLGPGAPRALRVRCGLNKTAHKHGKARTVTLLDTGDKFVSPITLFLKLRAARSEPGVELGPPSGLLFVPKAKLLNKKGVPVPAAGRKDVKPMSHKHMQAILAAAQADLGPEYAKMPLTPHAFRAAGAAKALAEGVPMDQVLHAFNWRSPEMANHYVELRVLYNYKGPMLEPDDPDADVDSLLD